MSLLRATLRKDAALMLHELIEAAQDSIHRIAEGTGIPDTTLMRLALGGRTESICKKAIGFIAAKREQELLALYQKESTVTDIGKASGKTGG